MFQENSKIKDHSRCRKRLDKAVKGVNIDYAACSIRKKTEADPDTKHRLEIQSYIHKLISENKEFEYILKELNKKFSDSKYKEYFPNWIMDKIERSKRTNNKGREF